jgi:hypothetical protein
MKIILRPATTRTTESNCRSVAAVGSRTHLVSPAAIAPADSYAESIDSHDKRVNGSYKRGDVHGKAVTSYEESINSSRKRLDSRNKTVNSHDKLANLRYQSTSFDEE